MSEMYKNKDGKVVVIPGRFASGPEYQKGGKKAKGFAAHADKAAEWGRRGGSARKSK